MVSSFNDFSELSLINEATQTAPINFLDLYEQIGIVLRRTTLEPGVDSTIYCCNGVTNVTVTNSYKMNSDRFRFTLAHNLGHHIMHRDILAKSRQMHVDRLWEEGGSPAPLSANQDNFANRLAIQMLAPVAVIRHLIAEGYNVEQMAAHLMVSPKMMELRVKGLQAHNLCHVQVGKSVSA